MFAVIRSGGKQYRVAQDDVLTVERLDGDVGATLKLEDVLLLGGDNIDLSLAHLLEHKMTGGGPRLDTAAALFEKGIGQRLLISGVDIATTRATFWRR